MPNTSRAHSLHLSLCSVLGEVELQHIVVFNLYKKQLFCYFWKKKKTNQALRELLYPWSQGHGLRLGPQGRSRPWLNVGRRRWGGRRPWEASPGWCRAKLASASAQVPPGSPHVAPPTTGAQGQAHPGAGPLPAAALELRGVDSASGWLTSAEHRSLQGRGGLPRPLPFCPLSWLRLSKMQFFP